MKSNYKISFGIDGWRGKVDNEVNNQSIARVAQAFADYLIFNSQEVDSLKVAVSYDGRKDSKTFARLFARVLSANNITAYLADKTGTTPVLSYYTRAQKLNAGVIITASHLPPDYNGVKIKAAYGGPFLSQDTLNIEKYLDYELIQADEENIYLVDLRSTYYEHLERIIEFDSIHFSGIRVLIDSMSGSGQQVIETLLTNHRIEAKTIYKIAEPDFSGRRPEPIETNLQPLRDELIKDKKFSIGLALDGDADRLGVMTETGEYISSQEVSLLLTDYIINRKKVQGDIIRTATITERLDQHFNSDSHKVIEVPFGFKYICEKMTAGGVAFGCEESGGYGFREHIPERDGILSGLLMLEMLAKSPYKKLSELIQAKRKEFGHFYFRRHDLEFNANERADKLASVRSALPSSVGSSSISDIKEFYDTENNLNAFKIFFNNHNKWLLLRLSETENLIRIYAESESESETASLIGNALNLIK